MTTEQNQSLAGHVVVVTGAAQGIGAGIVEAVLEGGGSAVLLDLDQVKAEETAAKLDPGGERTLALAADVTNEAAVEAASASILKRFGKVDGWVNNAGIVQMMAAEKYSAEEWDREFAVNVRGVMTGARAAFRLMNQRGGSIVNIASNAGKVG
ncbi:MAG: SDR family NAD(P)-dependent oxidoreductase, partial [Bauldia sp.]